MSLKTLAVDGAAPETIIDEIAGALKEPLRKAPLKKTLDSSRLTAFAAGDRDADSLAEA